MLDQAATILAQPTLERVLLQVDALPPLPEVAQAILRFGDGGDAGLRGLCLRIQHDVGLTSRVLRVANSPFYGLQGSVHTLDDALVVLGSSTLRAIALTGALMAPFDVRRSARFDSRQFWRHSLASGLLAQRLAPAIGFPPAQAFTAGLLHQAGILALCTVQPQQFDRLQDQAAATRVSLSSACRATLGWDPTALCAALARRWALPEELCVAMADWREPPAGGRLRADRQLADLIHVADRLAHLLAGMPAGAWPKDQAARLAELKQRHPLDPGAVERLGLDQAGLLSPLPAAARELTRLEALLT